MAIHRYLAMTDAEFSGNLSSGWRPAWMACHFSPYDSGLTNLPPQLPKGTLLILNDRIPPMNCDSGKVFSALAQIVYTQSCAGLLLDFQQPDSRVLYGIAKELIKLPCPVAVSLPYAKEFSCPVFLPPVPILTPIEDYLSRWSGREIWLEVALSPTEITVNTNGSKSGIAPYLSSSLPLKDQRLFCHYKLTLQDSCGIFHLQRTQQDMEDLMAQAAKHGVTTAVGLWQELK